MFVEYVDSECVMKIAIIANGGLGLNALRLTRKVLPQQPCLVISDPRNPACGSLAVQCQRGGISLHMAEKVNAEDVVERLADVEPDYLFNINSYQILRNELLALPHIATINLHNGPLSRYGGVNVVPWAVFNRETEYGITWHIVDRGIDTGDIVVQRRFPVPPTITAGALFTKCIAESLAGYRDLLTMIEAGPPRHVPQDHDKSTYYSRKDLPFNGVLPFDEEPGRLDALLRAIDMRPLKVGTFTPRFFWQDSQLVLEQGRLIRQSPDGRAPGEIVSLAEEEIHVAVRDAILVISQVRMQDGTRIALNDLASSLGLRAGGLFCSSRPQEGSDGA